MKALRVLVLALFLAGCFGGGPNDTGPPDSQSPVADESIWLTQGHGCGACATDGPWADAIVVYGDGDALWFLYGPGEGPGTTMPAEHEPLRAALEEALAHFEEHGAFHAQHSPHHVYNALVPWGADERESFQQRIEPHLQAIDGPPGYENRCEEYMFPFMTVAHGAGTWAGDAPHPGDNCTTDPTDRPWNQVSLALGEERSEAAGEAR